MIARFALAGHTQVWRQLRPNYDVETRFAPRSPLDQGQEAA